MLLAGDVGGTKTLLGLFAPGEARPTPVRVASFVTLEHESLPALIRRFLDTGPAATIDAASLGVAGPVNDQRARLTNVPWAIAAADIAARCALRSVTLLNDLEAMAHAVPVLEGAELVPIKPGRPVAGGHAALIAAGTGLGEAFVHIVDHRPVAFASEGGHADYSARTDAEVGLMRLLTARYGRAEWEQVLSGPGLVNIHRFTHPHACAACPASTDEAHLPALISSAALEGRCPECVQALEMFVVAYGAEAGNLALRAVATGGVFLGGGIAPKILPALRAPAFVDAFRGKPPMEALLDAIPVQVIVNEQAALLGAAVHANRVAGPSTRRSS
jgi:glucokinase